MKQVLVCQYINCQRNGSAAILADFQSRSPANCEVIGSDCQGQCNLGPTVRVLPDETWYCRVKPADVPTIVEHHLEGGEPVAELLHPRFHPRFTVQY